MVSIAVGVEVKVATYSVSQAGLSPTVGPCPSHSQLSTLRAKWEEEKLGPGVRRSTEI